VSIALARKYRPTSFDELIGQETVSQTLTLALQNDKLSHAYLFSGLRGSGKTSTARIFAKSLLCERGVSPYPCNSCNSCIMANETRHIDIIEMDGASNRKIDDIRELIEHTKYKPSISRYKIFIIDEVHMLTKEAFNALLKTLEEPPNFVKFILATTDPLKLPVTILSRTQHFRFKKIPQIILERHLEHILNLEQVGYQKEAIEIIARYGGGSVRDSLTLLDQAIVYSKNYIDVNTVTNMLGIIEPSLLENLIDNIINKNEKAIIEFISLSKEYEAEMIIDELSLYLKNLLLSNSYKITPMIIERFFRVLSDAKTLLNIGSDGEFVLALTLFKMIESLNIQDIDSMIKSLNRELNGINFEVDKKIEEKKTQQIEIKEKIKEVEAPKTKKVETEEDKGKILFKKLTDKLYDRNFELGECFESNITYNSFENNLLTWESIAIDNDKKMLRNNWGLIRTFVQDIFGIETKIKNISKASTIKPKKEIEKEIITQQENNPPIELEKKEETKEEKKNILDEPMIAKVLELFEPKKVRVKRKNQ
jgi:DNA polymerase-3 subunit gamma/tau